MILLINGAFGVGKTTVAEKLHGRIENSIIYDPEVVGYMLREMLPQEIKKAESPTGDFQDFILWKELVVEMAKRLKTQYGKDLIIPMTIRNSLYFNYIVGGFKMIDSNTVAFCLTATEETIHQRLVGRGETPGDWCFLQTTPCIESYKTGEFGIELNTENHSAEDIVNRIIQNIHALK